MANQQVVTALVPQDLSTSDHGTILEKPGQLGAAGAHLSEKAKSIFSHGLSIHPTPTSVGASALKRFPEPAEGSHISRRAPEKQHKELQPLQSASSEEAGRGERGRIHGQGQLKGLYANADTIAMRS